MATSDGVQSVSPASRARRASQAKGSGSSDLGCRQANATGPSQLAGPNALSRSPHLTMDRVQILVLPYMPAGWLAP